MGLSQRFQYPEMGGFLSAALQQSHGVNTRARVRATGRWRQALRQEISVLMVEWRLSFGFPFNQRQKGIPIKSTHSPLHYSGYPGLACWIGGLGICTPGCG